MLVLKSLSLLLLLLLFVAAVYISTRIDEKRRKIFFFWKAEKMCAKSLSYALLAMCVTLQLYTQNWNAPSIRFMRDYDNDNTGASMLRLSFSILVFGIWIYVYIFSLALNFGFSLFFSLFLSQNFLATQWIQWFSNCDHMWCRQNKATFVCFFARPHKSFVAFMSVSKSSRPLTSILLDECELKCTWKFTCIYHNPGTFGINFTHASWTCFPFIC